jgi:hypothetical protein
MNALWVSELTELLQQPELKVQKERKSVAHSPPEPPVQALQPAFWPSQVEREEEA